MESLPVEMRLSVFRAALDLSRNYYFRKRKLILEKIFIPRHMEKYEDGYMVRSRFKSSCQLSIFYYPRDRRIFYCWLDKDAFVTLMLEFFFRRGVKDLIEIKGPDSFRYSVWHRIKDDGKSFSQKLQCEINGNSIIRKMAQ